MNVLTKGVILSRILCLHRSPYPETPATSRAYVLYPSEHLLRHHHHINNGSFSQQPGFMPCFAHTSESPDRQNFKSKNIPGTGRAFLKNTRR